VITAVLPLKSFTFPSSSACSAPDAVYSATQWQTCGTAGVEWCHGFTGATQ
jgi:hypothetical protein